MPSVSSDSRTIRQHCSVCKSDYDMEIIREGAGEGVVWLKCPGCEGFLPYMPEENASDESGASNEPESVQLEDLDLSSAREYAEDQTYEIGEVVHHRSWNDYGKVVAKDRLPGNRRTIWVQFVRQGRVQLLEGVAH